MVCCLLLFSDDEVEGDKRAGLSNQFQISMMESGVTGCKGQPLCCAAMILPQCTAFYARYSVLGEDCSKYRCCQGYLDGFCCGCWKSGMVCESACPCPCMFLESFLCLGFAVSSTRLYVMDSYELTSDPCDRRMIRFTNCLYLLSCICHILSMLDDSFSQLACILDRISDIVFLMTTSCMTSQTLYEYTYQQQRQNKGNISAEGIPIKYSHNENKVTPHNHRNSNSRGF